ncbi:MAG: radical SAM protein [Candidatus Heimdallarchaeota archaeon]|nr:radical SAM protein [Candidatus Heimdallarchaeota archaeon]
MGNSLKIHEILPHSRANGPGIRYTIWFQGCHFNCTGCINPQTHNINEGYSIPIDKLINDTIFDNRIEGITLTGGEPLIQAEKLIIFLKEIREKTHLSVILLTGYDSSELKKLNYYSELINLIDVIVSGRYIEEKRISYGLRGSSNKEYIFLSNCYTLEDIQSSPLAEIQFSDNKKIISGSFIDIFLK